MDGGLRLRAVGEGGQREGCREKQVKVVVLVVVMVALLGVVTAVVVVLMVATRWAV